MMACETPAHSPAKTGALLSKTLRRFTRWQQIQISAATAVGYLATAAIGRSLRWEIYGWENWEAARRAGKGLIYTFWHREICSATWLWRKRGIVVMTSQNFDGEYIARIIRKYGYGAARGSSSRGASRALVEMIRHLKQGRDAAFTIDGPRGPRFIAKQGSVLLSRATGAAILCFHIAPLHSHVFRRSWDFFQIPRPFSRTATFIAPPIFVPPGGNEKEQKLKLQEVQLALEELQKKGDAWRGGFGKGRAS
ncbi:MAG: lysophospholipid acyltransferase family protein [Terriglobia bacterium]